MRFTPFCLILILAGFGMAGDLTGVTTLGRTPGQIEGKRLWEASIISMAAANTSDILSSRGMEESNPIFRGTNGTFSTDRGIALKSLYVVSVAAVQWVVLRHHPRYVKLFTAIDFGMAGTTGAISAHNWSLH